MESELLQQPEPLQLDIYIFFLVFFCFVFLGLYPQHMEVPRLGVQSSCSH